MIYGHWQERSQPGISSAEKVYNMDEMGILLSTLNSPTVLAGRIEARKYRGAGVQHTVITAFECISSDSKAV